MKEVSDLDSIKAQKQYKNNRSSYLRKKERNKQRGEEMKKVVKPGMIVLCEGTRDPFGIREVIEVKKDGIVGRKIIKVWKGKRPQSGHLFVRDEYITTNQWDKIVKIIYIEIT